MGTPVTLPRTQLFPVEITEVCIAPGAHVSRQQRLLKFKYWHDVPDGVGEDGQELPPVRREFYGFLESPIDGEVTDVSCRCGQLISNSDTEVLRINERCDHSVQYGGLCALCGISLDQKDYLPFADEDRAPIRMAHDTSGLTVSMKEAERLESSSTSRLLSERRLALVVDLDQTVVHASVSPEISRALCVPVEEIPEELRDVQRFALRERARPNGETSVQVAHPAASVLEPVRHAAALQQPDIRWYYIKLRPGLHAFLEEMCTKYEMHVYTMATRQYALEVARAIDPTGKYFADRILSRDASGSLLHKELKRLFPVNTNMVTIIDDRGDVWNWSPHLIRCVPYHFWSNTGDINSQFLPKRDGLVTPTDEKEVADHELKNVGRALTELHTKFYAQPIKNEKMPDVGKLLPAMKERVFDGCVLLFTGFFPVGLASLDSADIVQWVRSFGAVVVAQYIPQVTHVISRNPGTLKARLGAGNNKHVVQIEWVFACIEQWRRVPETDYALKVSNPIKSESEAGELAEGSEGAASTAGDAAEVDSQVAGMFVRSLERGDLDFNEMDEELRELLGDEDEDDQSSDQSEEEETKDKDAKETTDDTKDINSVPPSETSATNSDNSKNQSNPASNLSEPVSRKRKRDETLDLELELDDDWD